MRKKDRGPEGGCTADVAGLIRDPGVARALAWAVVNAAQAFEEAIRVCEVPFFTFEEAERAAYMKDRVVALGLADVTIDHAGNLRGRRAE